MIEPLYKGVTRPATYFGIPVKPFLFCFLPIGILSMLISIWIWLALIPVYFIMRLILLTDDKFFTEINALANFWHKTKGKYYD